MARGKKRRKKKRPGKPSPEVPTDTSAPVGKASAAAEIGDETRSPLRGAAVVLAVAFAVRVLVSSTLAKSVLFSSPQLDQFEFLRWAESIAAGNPIWMASHAPGYPFFLGTLLSLFDGSLVAVRTVQALLGAGTCALVTVLGIRWFSRRSGIAAGLLLAAYGPLVFVESSLLAEGLFVFLLVASLAAFSRRSPAWLVGAGALLGLATIVRATGAIVLPAFMVVLLLEGGASTALRRYGRRRWLSVGILIAAWLVVVVPTARNFGQRFDAPFFLQGFGGLNLLMGNDPAGQGVPSARLGEAWDALAGEAYRQGHLKPAERERFYTGRAVDRMLAEPMATAGVMLRKAVWLTQSEEPRDTHSFYFFAEKSLLLRLLPGLGVLLALACLGGFGLWRRRRLRLDLLLYLASIAASCVLIIMSLRYRLPMVPVLAILGGVAIDDLLGKLERREHRALALSAIAALAIFGFSHVWTHEPTHDFSEEIALTASSMERDDRLDAAERTYREALELDPSSGYARAGLGRVLMRQGDAQAAEETFRIAIGHSPGYSRAHGGLGSLLWTQGRPTEALVAYREAHRLSPDTPEIGRDLGRLLVESGELDEAAELFGRLLVLDPNDTRSLLALARIEGARGRPAEGVEPARRASRLDAGNAHAWLVLAMLATAANDLVTGEEALGRAQGLVGPSDPRIRFGRALVLRQRGDLDRANRILGQLMTDHPDFDPAQMLGGG